MALLEQLEQLARANQLAAVKQLKRTAVHAAMATQTGALPRVVQLLASNCRQTRRCATIILYYAAMVCKRVSFWREVKKAGAVPKLMVLLDDDGIGDDDVGTHAANALRELTEAALYEDDVQTINLILNSLQQPVPRFFPRLLAKLRKAVQRSYKARPMNAKRAKWLRLLQA